MSYQANHPIESWLAQEVPEEVLEPELPIVDPVRRLSPQLELLPSRCGCAPAVPSEQSTASLHINSCVHACGVLLAA